MELEGLEFGICEAELGFLLIFKLGVDGSTGPMLVVARGSEESSSMKVG